MRMDANRKTADDLFFHLSSGDITGALALLTDDVAWTIAGRREDLPTAGTYDKKRFEKLMNAMRSQMTGPMHFTITGRVAEGNKIALEAESTGYLTNGRTYNQQFHFLLEFRGGKVCTVREYLDTHHAYNIWYTK
jgi:uncharacterized protein